MNSFSQPHPAQSRRGRRSSQPAADSRASQQPAGSGTHRAGMTPPGQRTGNVFRPSPYQCATEAAILTADHPGHEPDSVAAWTAPRGPGRLLMSHSQWHRFYTSRSPGGVQGYI